MARIAAAARRMKSSLDAIAFVFKLQLKKQQQLISPDNNVQQTWVPFQEVTIRDLGSIGVPGTRSHFANIEHDLCILLT